MIIVETDTGTSDLGAGENVGSFTATVDTTIKYRVNMAAMDATAATLTTVVSDGTTVLDSFSTYKGAVATASVKETVLVLAGETITIAITSSNTDATVTWTTEWGDMSQVDMASISGDSTAADNIKTEYDGTGLRGNVIYVTDDGDNGNSGTSPQYAVADVAAAITRLSLTYDTIYLMQGNHTGPLDLSANTGITVTGHPSAQIDAEITLGDRCSVENITIGHFGSIDGTVIMAGDNSSVRNLRIWASTANGIGIDITGKYCTVDGCYMLGSEHGIRCQGGGGFALISNCTMDMDGNYTESDAVGIYAAQPNITIENCIIRAYREVAGDATHRAVGILIQNIEVLVKGCNIFADADLGAEDYAYGVYVVNGEGTVVNSTIRSLASANAYDLVIENGTLYSDGNGYDHDKVSGTVTYVDVTPAIASIKALTFDGLTAFPTILADTGATRIARTGEDADTLETLSDQIDAVPTATEIDTELTSNHGAGAWTSANGAGATSRDYTLTEYGTGDPIEGASIRVTTDVGGSVTYAQGNTDSNGVFTFYHDFATGTTLYVWRSKGGYSFDNPDIEVI